MGLGTRDQCWLGGIRGLRMTSSPTKAAFGRGGSVLERNLGVLVSKKEEVGI